MAGFALPKLRWLVVGAVAAGVWAARQEPIDGGERRVASRPSASLGEQQPGKHPLRHAQASVPRYIEQAVPRPSKVVTGSMKPGDNPAPQRLYTTSRVRLRGKAGITAPIVATLEPGQAVAILERSGKWQRVAAAGHKGWVHGDFLGLPDAHVPRPKELVAKPGSGVAAKGAVAATNARMPPTSNRPARSPQHGDCQCPYDLMIDGRQCGDRSAYVMRAEKAQCYL